MPLTNFGQSDVVYFQNNDGDFSKAVIDEKIAEPSTGLGVLVTDFDGDRINEIFVANDARTNHFLRFDTSSGRFWNQAASRGLAVGFSGVANACMGIATGDFDRNRRVDMHVTNYSTESVNLYLQDTSGSYCDSATRLGLEVSSKPMVGFGTKAIDLNRDGWLDVIATNGHVFDRTEHGEEFRMPGQIFLSRGSNFVEVGIGDGSTLNQHRLTSPALGRAMTKVDFDRDLDSDLVVNYLDRRVSIFENRSLSSGQVVHVRLIGVTSERDAVGAAATLQTSDGSFTRWVTAGDGYMSSDDPILEFTIPNQAEVGPLEIRWPSGKLTRHEMIEQNCLYLAAENETELWKLIDLNR
ncbi:MAG: CRTAC1 family protein [Planctomycetota bacterium]